MTRVANYSRFYGSFGAGIATLVWLYITSFSVLLGAELNGVLYWERQGNRRNSSDFYEQLYQESKRPLDTPWPLQWNQGFLSSLQYPKPENLLFTSHLSGGRVHVFADLSLTESPSHRRAKIVATLGPASNTEPVFRG